MYKTDVNNNPYFYLLRSSHSIFPNSIGYTVVHQISLNIEIAPINNTLVSQQLGITPICII